MLLRQSVSDRRFLSPTLPLSLSLSLPPSFLSSLRFINLTPRLPLQPFFCAHLESPSWSCAFSHSSSMETCTSKQLSSINWYLQLPLPILPPYTTKYCKCKEAQGQAAFAGSASGTVSLTTASGKPSSSSLGRCGDLVLHPRLLTRHRAKGRTMVQL